MNFLEKQNFDFLYDGKRIDECPHQLTITTHEDTVTKEFLFHDGLKVINITKRYAAFDAYEWATWFENTSDHPTNVISNIKDCCCNFEFPSDQQYDWHSTYQPDFHKALKVFNPIGSYCNEKDFQMPMDANESGRCFNHLYNHDTFNYKPAGGRSSDGQGYHIYDLDLYACSTEGSAPFFNLYCQQRGVIFAVGWSGQWNCCISRNDEYVHVETGIENVCTALLPGEKIRTSSFVCLTYEGNFNHGQNKWRQLVKKHFSPVGVSAHNLFAPFCKFVWGGMSSDFVLKTIDIIKREKLPFEYLWMDAGWYGTAPASSSDAEGVWGAYTGDWSVNQAIHPRGLKDVSSALKDAGLKFLLWFEPERITKKAPIVSQHPEYLLPMAENSDEFLLNLGFEPAWNYCYELLSNRISELNIGCLRLDFNTSPLSTWRSLDSPARTGITEIKYINGLYRLLDALCNKYPDLLIDDCASGGRRIDIEMLRRSVALWRSDYTCPANYPVKANQLHNMAFSTWLPYSGTTSGLTIGDSYYLRSAYTAAINFGYNLVGENGDAASSEDINWIRKSAEEYLKVRPFFSEDFYPLTEPSFNEDCWCASQWHRPSRNDGIIQVFKRERSAYTAATYYLGGICAESKYKIIDADSNETICISGMDLLQKGFRVEIVPARTAKLFFYQEIK